MRNLAGLVLACASVFASVSPVKAAGLDEYPGSDADGSRTFGATAVGTKQGAAVTRKGNNVLAGCLILTNVTDASVSASIPELGISVTATVSPVKSVWDPGDGSVFITCERGVEWDESLVGKSPCGRTYRATTQHDGESNPITIKTTITWEVTYTCVPAGSCTGPPNVPGQIITMVSRDVLVTAIRGILTG